MVKRSEIVSSGGRLYHLGVAPGQVARRVFMVGDPARAYKVAAHFDSIEHEVSHREYVTLTGPYRGLEFSVIGTGMGTDNVEIALVELHGAHAIDLETGETRPDAPRLDIIRVGTSGGVQPDIPAGTLCVAEYALGLDSAGPYYELPPADEVVEEIEARGQDLLDAAIAGESRFRSRIRSYAAKASVEVYASLLRQAEAADAPHTSGITVTSPGFYGPSSRYIEGLVNTVPDIKGTLAELSVGGRRVVNMEMESSLLFHLAGALGHRAGTICPAISQPGTPDAIVDYDATIESAIRIALAAMVELAGSPA